MYQRERASRNMQKYPDILSHADICRRRCFTFEVWLRPDLKLHMTLAKTRSPRAAPRKSFIPPPLDEPTALVAQQSSVSCLPPVTKVVCSFHLSHTTHSTVSKPCSPSRQSQQQPPPHPYTRSQHGPHISPPARYPLRSRRRSCVLRLPDLPMEQ